jgi:transcriptional/translational regulatory protein YebC/TACO1
MPARAVYSVRFEGYGPGDSAVMVECRTADHERMKAELRRVFVAHGGRLGAAGSVAYLFKQVGLLEYPSGARPEPLTGSAWEAGAEDVVLDRKGSIQVLTDPVELEAVRSRLQAAGYEVGRSEVTCRAAATVQLAGAAATQMVRLYQALEALEGVEAIYTNAEIAGEVLASV